MRILVVSNGYPPSAYGGVEVNSLEIVRELKRRGHVVAVFCRERDLQRPDYTVIQDVHEEVPVTRIVNDFKRVTSFRQLYSDENIDSLFSKVLDEFQPDVVHFNHFLALSATLPQETARRGIAAVTTLHDYWSICHRINLLNSDQAICPGPAQGGDCYRCLFVTAGERGKFLRLLKRILPYNIRVLIRRLTSQPGKGELYFSATRDDLALRQETFYQALNQVQAITVPSEFVRSMLAANGIQKEKIQVIPLGIGLVAQNAQVYQNGPVRFGFVGSILPTKGLESLIRAFRATDAENIRLAIHGREDIQPVFARQVRALAAGDPRITFHGSFAPDQRKVVYEGFNVFVMPSVWHETFSFVAREALISGLPVIAARVGALSEVIHHAVNGFLYPPGDEAALSALFGRIARKPEMLNNLQIPGPIVFLTLEDYAERLEGIYTTVIFR